MGGTRTGDGLPAPRLLERDDEIDRMRGLVAATRGGDGALMVVEGPPGIGKTELLGAVGGLAAQAGFAVLHARGGELEHGFAFGVVRQLFEAPVTLLSAGERAELLSGAASLAGPVVDPRQAPAASSPPAYPFPLLHGLYWLAANLADRSPLALLVDDAHWADGPSLRWLHYLSRRLEGVAALVVLATRSTEPEAPVELVEAIKAEPSCVLVQPTPLSEPASAQLLGDLLGSEPADELVREAHAVTRGNPFLLNELGRALATDRVVPDAAAAARLRALTPETIVRSVLARLARLPSGARDLACAVALLGQGAELRHAAALAGLEEQEALAAADRLGMAGLLEPGPQLGFAHPLIRQALYADLGEGERAGRHKDAARLLAAESPERAAVHLLAATPTADTWVVAVLRAAAAAAEASGGPDVAASFLRRALAEPPPEEARAEVLLEVGLAEAHAADPGALDHLEAAATVARDPLQRARALGMLTFLRYAGGDPVGAAAAAREALRQMSAGAGGEPEAQLLVSYCLAGRAVPELVDEVSAALAVPRTGPDGETTAAEIARHGLAALDAVLRGTLSLAAQRLRWVAEHGAHAPVGVLPLMLGSLLTLLGAHREAEAEIERALARASRSGSHLDMVTVLEARTHLRWRSGDLAGAIADAETGLRICRETAGGVWDPATVPTRVAQAACLVERGEPEAAQAALALPEALEARLPGIWGWLWLPFGRATLASARGDWSEAKTQALAAGERLLTVQAPSPDYLPWRALAAQALARLGERDRALEVAGEDVTLSRATGSARATGIALATLGTIETGQQGLDALDESVELLAGSPARLEHARALVELGAALRRANRRADAREPLRQAIELARACGARPLAERAEAELRATGARPRGLVFTGVDALTARERQVAELAAGGRSNPEIAQTLFVTRKTVETHLGSVYRKLGLESRGQLAGALLAAGGGQRPQGPRGGSQLLA